MLKLKNIIILLFISTSLHGQIIKTDIFTVNYSEEYQHNLYH